MKTQQTSLVNSLYSALDETQLGQIQGGGQPEIKDRARSFKPTDKDPDETILLQLVYQ